MLDVKRNIFDIIRRATAPLGIVVTALHYIVRNIITVLKASQS